jgi:hypothetical protein
MGVRRTPSPLQVCLAMWWHGYYASKNAGSTQEVLDSSGPKVASRPTYLPAFFRSQPRRRNRPMVRARCKRPMPDVVRFAYVWPRRNHRVSDPWPRDRAPHGPTVVRTTLRLGPRKTTPNSRLPKLHDLPHLSDGLVRDGVIGHAR